MTLPEWPSDTEHPDQGCRFFYENALPLMESHHYEEALPLMVDSLRILTRCGQVAGSPHPRQHVVYRELINLLLKMGHSMDSAEAYATRVVIEARESAQS